MNAHQARAAHPRRDQLHPPTADSPPITDPCVAEDDDHRCPHSMDECPQIVCTLRDGHPGLCWNVRRTPYRAVYWEAPE